MDILIVDPDRGVQDYYRRLLESEFRNVDVRFAASIREAHEAIARAPCDVALTESKLPDGDVFDFLKQLAERKIPAIVISSESSERLIVECLRAGALDFVGKRNIKLGHLAYVIARAVLEADRWLEILNFSASRPRHEEFEKINRRVRGFLSTERAELARAELERKDPEAAPAEFTEGQTYWINYLYLQLYFPGALKNSADPRRFLAMQDKALTRLIEAGATREGRLWTRKEDGCFFAFVGETETQALLAALEMRANLNILNLTLENLPEPIQANIAITAGQTVYREVKSNIYSEALNLAAHMAINNPARNVTLLTADVYEKLGPRARKYFFSAGAFEGHSIYKFERIA